MAPFYNNHFINTKINLGNCALTQYSVLTLCFSTKPNPCQKSFWSRASHVLQLKFTLTSTFKRWYLGEKMTL